jgi:hypothetical protein
VGDQIHREVVAEESAGGVAVARDGRLELDSVEDLVDSDSLCKLSESGSRGVPWPDGYRGWKAYGATNLGSWFRSIMPAHSGVLGTVRPWRNMDDIGLVLDRSELVGPFGGKQALPNSVEGGSSDSHFLEVHGESLQEMGDGWENKLPGYQEAVEMEMRRTEEAAEGLRQLSEGEVLTPVMALAAPRAAPSLGQVRKRPRAMVMERRYKRKLKEISVASALFSLTSEITRRWNKIKIKRNRSSERV